MSKKEEAIELVEGAMLMLNEARAIRKAARKRLKEATALVGVEEVVRIQLKHVGW